MEYKLIGSFIRLPISSHHYILLITVVKHTAYMKVKAIKYFEEGS